MFIASFVPIPEKSATPVTKIFIAEEDVFLTGFNLAITN